jgi:ACS family tartrate transporter-like MFS transporter
MNQADSWHVPQAAHDLGVRAVRKIARRLVPFLGILYLVSFLDRVNIGFAALTMNADLGLTPVMFGIGSGIFFLGYILAGIPSNAILIQVGARRWISIIMIGWGLVSASLALTNGPGVFYMLRFFLGVAEAGFFPGIILYLTYWFPAAYRGRILGAFLLALPISNVIGAPVSTALLALNEGGLKGWQWMFLLEGLPAVVLGYLTWHYLADSPADATWLAPEERQWLESELAKERLGVPGANDATVAQGIGNTRVWGLSLIYFGICVGLYTYGFWLPQIIKSVVDLTNRQIGLVTMIPYAIAGCALYGWGRYSDRHPEARQDHVAWPALLGALGLAASAWPHLSSTMSLMAITVAASGIYASIPPFWTLPTRVLPGASAAGGIALINTLGNVGGFVGPSLLGFIKKSTGSYGPSLWTLSGILLVGSLLVKVIKLESGHRRALNPLSE